MRPQALFSWISASVSAPERSTVCAAVLAALLLASGCGKSVWPDREGAEAENIRVDTVRALPEGSRFILRDSATEILLSGYHAGYECSRILEMSLDSADTGSSPTYRPRTRVLLPATPDCPVDAGDRDTVLTHIFTGSDTVRFANSSGTVTHTAVVVKGALSFDTVKGVPDSVTRNFRSGRWIFSDSSAVAAVGRTVSADSLPACQFLNHAEHSRRAGYRQGDTVTVRIALVTLDSADVPDGCLGTRPDIIQAFPAPP